MNCQEFENIVNDLARQQLLEAGTSEGGLLHAEACRRCAARLADERALGAGLRAVAARLEGREAPAAIELGLLAAFRERKAAFIAPTVITPRHRRAHWAWIAAAAVVVLSTLALAYLLRTAQPEANQQVNGRQLPSPSPTLVPLEDRREPPGSSLSPRPLIVQHAPSRPRRDQREQPVPPRGAKVSAENRVTESEIATDFLPLTYGAQLAPLESGQVVRVAMPRSALISFGLPMNMERADESVKADVLLGADGVARAIRFVR